MQNLEMDTGPKYLKYGILGGIAVVFAVAAFVMTRSDKPAEDVAAQTAAESTDANQIAAEPTATDPAAATDPSAAMASAEPAAMPAEPAPAGVDGAMTAAAAPATAPSNATQQPAMNAPAGADPSISETLTAETPLEPMSEPAPATAASETAASDVASAEPVSKSAETEAPKQPVGKVAPPAAEALRSWWSPGASSAFNVEYVGQLVDQNSLVILFSGPVQDTAAASQHIRVVAEDGSPVNTNWQTGGNTRMIVQNDLEPGRYIVMIDPAVSNAQGQSLGATLRGPVYIQ